jgi:hypothetical protein
VYPAHVVEVAISSRDDTGRFRAAIGHALNSWNGANAELHHIVLVPVGAQPRPANVDLTIVIVDPTLRDVDEVMRDVVSGKGAAKLVLAWLVAEPPSHGFDPDDQALLGDLTERLMKEGVFPRYLGTRDAQFESRMHDAMTADLTDANLSPLTARFRATASIREVVIYRTPVPLLGPHIYAVTVANDSTSVAIDLTVLVDAVDSDGTRVPDGATRSTQDLADVFAKLRSSPTPQERRSAVPTTRLDLLAAHTALGFPRWLRPRQHASALYAVAPNASPQVQIQFEDETGELWSRANDAEPEKVSP